MPEKDGVTRPGLIRTRIVFSRGGARKQSLFERTDNSFTT